MLKHVSILGVARTVPIGLAFVQSIVVARILGPEAFGAVALVVAFPTLVHGILNVRTTETTTRFLAGFDVHAAPARALGLCKVAYLIDLAVAIVAFGVVGLSAAWVGPRVLDRPELVPLMVVFALTFLPNALVPTSGAVLAVTGRFGLTGMLEVAGAVMRSGLVMTLVALGYGVHGVVYGLIAGNAALGLSMALVAHRVAATRWSGSWLGSGWADLAGYRRELARFFVLSDLTALFGVAIKNADVLLLAYFRPTLEIGYYNLGKSITNQLLSLVAVVRIVGFPQVMRLWTTGAWRDLWTYVRRHTLLFGVPGIAGVGLLMLILEFAIDLVYGDAFVPAAPVARLLLLQVVLLLVTLWIDMVLRAWGDLQVLLVSRASGAVAMVAVIVALAPRWGVEAAAIALLIQQTLGMIITFGWMYGRRRRRREEAARRRRDGLAAELPLST